MRYSFSSEARASSAAISSSAFSGLVVMAHQLCRGRLGFRKACLWLSSVRLIGLADHLGVATIRLSRAHDKGRMEDARNNVSPECHVKFIQSIRSRPIRFSGGQALFHLSRSWISIVLHL